MPYSRNKKLARPWAVPGTPELMHRVGGLEKEDGTGNVSYDPDNHQHMVEVRAEKIAGIADSIAPLEVHGADQGVLVLGWGGTCGALRTAVDHCLADNLPVAHAQLRWLNPFPRNLAAVIERYDTILIPELNTGQLRMLIDANFDATTVGLNKIKGKPFAVSEVESRIRELCR